MADYYIMTVDSYVNAFSMADTVHEIKYQYTKKKPYSNSTAFLQGDKIFVYRKKPYGRIQILLEACGDDSFKKLLEISEGVDPAEYSLNADLETEEVISVSREMYEKILKQLFSESILNEDLKDGQEEEINTTRITGGENVLLYGVPGAGKSFTIREKYCDDLERMERVVFHPDYTYSDFVGQILPKVENEQLKYVFTPGPFTKLLGMAWKNPDKEYYLIIEEINRGNAPAIFGEIFQLLDRKDKDNHKYHESEYGESEYGITNFEVADKVYGDKNHEVKIPSNMWILATMNTADQNVFTLDTAFQRRWNMHHIKNDVMSAVHANEKIEGTLVAWGAFASVINDMVADMSADLASSEDKRLGAYFVKPNELCVQKFPEKVLKYLWDDAFKMDKEAVFDDKFKSLEMVIDAYEKCENDKLQSVLRADVYRKMTEITSSKNNE